MCLANSGIVHKHFNRVTQQLSVVTPNDRLLVHYQARIFRVGNEKATYGLYIGTIGTHIIYTKNLTICLWRINVKGFHANGICVNKQCIVTFREVFGNRTRVATVCNGCRIGVMNIIALKCVLAFIIYIVYITFAFANVRLTII